MKFFFYLFLIFTKPLISQNNQNDIIRRLEERGIFQFFGFLEMSLWSELTSDFSNLLSLQSWDAKMQDIRFTGLQHFEK